MSHRTESARRSRLIRKSLSLSLLGALSAGLFPMPVSARETSFVLQEQAFSDQPFNDGDSMSEMPSTDSPTEMPSQQPSSQPASENSQAPDPATHGEFGMEEISADELDFETAEDTNPPEDDDDPGIPEGADDNHRKSDVKLDGIDISHWQDGINVREIEADFIICKATGGKGFLDKSFHAYAKDILDTGRLFGFYHYANDVGYKGTPEEEAAFFYKTVYPYLGKGIPILDYEDPDLLKSGTDWALRFVNAFYSLSGVKCMIYTSSYFSRSLDWSRVADEGYPLWIANYGKNKIQKGYAKRTWTDRFGTGAFDEYWMHQYSSRGQLEGYKGNLDLNKFFGTKEDWMSLCKAAPTETKMNRLYNPNSGEHFYTSNEAECKSLVDQGWHYEGIAWKLVKNGDPVFRLYNPNAGDHHYTLSEAERDSLVKAGWDYEGIGWYSDPSKGEPVYRAYNPNAKAGAHHFTVSEGEWRHLGENGWQREGIAWYGLGEVSEEQKRSHSGLILADLNPRADGRSAFGSVKSLQDLDGSAFASTKNQNDDNEADSTERDEQLSSAQSSSQTDDLSSSLDGSQSEASEDSSIAAMPAQPE